MALSYMGVTVVAVAIAELLSVGVLLPYLFGRAELQSRVRVTANQLAQDVYRANQSLDPARLQLPPSYHIVTSGGPGPVTYSDQGIEIPQDPAPPDDSIHTAGLVIAADGTVLASSYPARFPPGQPAAGLPALPRKPDASDVQSGRLVWATVLLYPTAAAAPDDSFADAWGWIYVQAPYEVPANFAATIAVPALGPGLLLLLVAVPIGVMFGILTTRRTVRRLERLSVAGERLGAGNLGQRIEPGPSDEVGRLERRFNLMAAALADARAAEHRQIEEDARGAERERIARELHDAVSQDLFSLGMLAGGMEQALTDGSALQAQARAMREAAEGAIQEMQALLLAMRPSALDEQGLVPALGHLCAAYRERLGVTIESDLQPVRLGPDAELALLRVAQEGVSNAVRHSGADRISLTLSSQGELVELSIADDGDGFDPADEGRHGLGLRVMRERLAELGGSVQLETGPGRGTRIRASLPRLPA